MTTYINDYRKFYLLSTFDKKLILCCSLGVLPPQVIDVHNETVRIRAYQFAYMLLVHPLVVLKENRRVVNFVRKVTRMPIATAEFTSELTKSNTYPVVQKVQVFSLILTQLLLGIHGF